MEENLDKRITEWSVDRILMDLLKQHKNFVFQRKMTDRDLWIFYAIKDFSDLNDIWINAVNGFHIPGAREKIMEKFMYTQ